MRQITRGASAGAGLIFHVFAQDSAATDGSGKASIAFGSWSCRYIRNGEAISGAITPQDIATIGTYAAPTANTNIRIKAVDNTNMIGVYELQIHADWVNTTNSCQSLTIYLTATGVAVLPLQIILIAANLQDTTRLGLTALPNAAADAAGGLPISDAGGLDLDARLDAAITSRLAPTVAGRTLDVSVGGEAGVDWANVGTPGSTVGLSATTIKTATDVETDTADIQTRLPAALVTGRMDASIGAVALGAITAAGFAANAIDAAALAADAVVEIQAGLATPTNITAGTITTVTNLTNAPTNGDLTAAMKASVTAAVPTALQNSDALLNRDMSAVSDTNSRTPLNALRFLRNKWTVAAGTLTVYEEDDVTSSWTAAVSTDAAAIPIVGNDPA